ncbi:MAG: rRNA methyltransferase, partial [Anaerolineae bacterium]|nr:rRNA methyltransferase [Anaerolineae bacterium]
MIITSAQNPKIKHVLGLVDRRRMRQRYRQFFVEGVRAINAAYEYGWEIECLIYCPECDLSDWAQGVVARTDLRVHLPVNAYLMERISQRSESSELVAVVRQAEDDLARVPISEHLLVVLVDRPQSPGNLGSLIRSC